MLISYFLDLSNANSFGYGNFEVFHTVQKCWLTVFFCIEI